MNKAQEIYRDNMFTAESAREFSHKLFFEKDRRQPYLVRFTTLLFLSTVIAAFGVLSDSTATVIGAMIIAPLMTPIMATAAALVVGDIKRSLQSLALVTAGVLLVIIVSGLIGFLYSRFNVIAFSQNSQIVGRMSPRLADLFIALASGAAGAFCMSRDDIADSLPGVAISISLVPPLCVTGIGLSNGQWPVAWGSFLLFMTNLLSILLAGGGVLAFLGLEQAANLNLVRGQRRQAFLLIGLAVLLVTIPLMITSARIADDTRIEYQTHLFAKDWIGDRAYELREVKMQPNGLEVLIAGEGEPPAEEELVAGLQERLEHKVVINLEVAPVEYNRLEIVPTRE
jgi:uncharacterized hydrophobic protein (TIGR00271 family)